MKTLFGILMAVLLLQGCRNPTGDLAPQNPLLRPPTPTPVTCAPGPLVWDDFSSGTTLNTATPWGDSGNGAVISGNMELTINSGTPNSWHINAKPGSPPSYGCGMNILATNGAVLNAYCKTILKYDIRTSVAATYTIRFKEDGATGADKENWVSPVQTSVAGTTFNTVALTISAFTEDPYGDPACAGSCANAGVGNGLKDMTAITRIELAFTAPAAAFDVYIDNIRFE